ncbi:fibrillarin-like rRNA/tRNA 2'-O-methyltransferase, partial [archaeon]|nr:fibrillarin-like rRNA/tRNA 2'-O-methyltransferase [archaeon]
MKIKKLMEGVFGIENKLATQNLVEGKKVYGEELIKVDDKEYRLWNPHRSKVAAAIKKGLKSLEIGKGSQILYLGAAEGTTISHLSDIIGENGVIFGVDISARSMRKFVYLCEQRPNMVPILADASQPMSYKEHMAGFSMDTLVQDVSKKNQAEIFL